MYPYIRLLHFDRRLSCELHLVPAGERWGYSDDDVYVGTFWDAAAAERQAAKILPGIECTYSP